MRYLPPNEYGVIGNHYSAALISNAGSIDWCCFPYLDSPSHFGALIDKSQGGKFQIIPQGEFRSKQNYIQKTKVLETHFETPTGRAVLTDWMPMGESSLSGPCLYRRIEVTEGTIHWLLTCTPRFRYGNDQGQAERHTKGILFRGGYAEDIATLYSEISMEISANGSSAIGKFDMNSGEVKTFLWTWGRIIQSEVAFNKMAVTQQLKHTIEAWTKQAHTCSTSGCVYAGPWHDIVTRSGLILKLLTAPYSGAISDAVFLSLKGILPGTITWGHRHASIRDGAFVIQALSTLGYTNEAHSYFAWIHEILERDNAEGLQPFYTLDGGKVVPERELPYVSGHTYSRQFQLDIYGHIVLAVSTYYRIYKFLPEDIWSKLVEIADYICQAWKRPDFGPWALTAKPEHFLVSKLFCWVALEEICQLGIALKKTISPRWLGEKRILHKTICDQGYDSTKNTFVRSFGDNEIDTSVLWIPLLRFLPFDDPRVQGTLDAVQAQLSSGVLIRRFRNAYELHSEEPMDLWSSFAFISCLALSGRTQEASDRLAEVCTYANTLGLFGDQVDLARESSAKIFPSSSAHLALINASLYVGSARKRHKAPFRLIGQENEEPTRISDLGKSIA